MDTRGVGAVSPAGGAAGPGLELQLTGERRTVQRPAVNLAVLKCHEMRRQTRERETDQTLALHAVVDPALSGGECEARDVLVATVPGVPAVGTAARLVTCLTVTLHLLTAHSAPLTPALVAAVPPGGALTVLLPLQDAVHAAVLSSLSPSLTLAPVGPGTVDAGGGLVAGRRPGLALVHVPAGGEAVHWIVVGGVSLPAGAVVPASLVHTDTLPAAPVDFIAKRTLVHVLLAVVARVSRGALAVVRGHAEAAVVTCGLAESCNKRVLRLKNILNNSKYSRRSFVPKLNYSLGL